MKPDISIIIPAKNEEALLPLSLQAVQDAVSAYTGRSEVIVVNNHSTDGTAEVIGRFASFTQLDWGQEGAARARNAGAASSCGEVLVFVDADTVIPPHSLDVIAELYDKGKYNVGLFRLNSLEGGFTAKVWWFFWNQVRRLPLPKAKSLPAFMFCSREVFDRFGPFDEKVHIAEEWPISRNYYRQHPRHFVYHRALAGASSNRRMALQRFGYMRTFLKYCMAVLLPRARVSFTNKIRHQVREGKIES